MRRVFARGFTLVEMLVVITIVVILAALLYPAVISMRNKAKKTECEALLMKVDAALRKYKTDTGEYPYMTANWETTNNLRSRLVGASKYLQEEDMPTWSKHDSSCSKSGTGHDAAAIYDNYVPDGEQHGKPLVYVYYTGAGRTGWPVESGSIPYVSGPHVGYKQEFQLWSLGPDGLFGQKSGTDILGDESQEYNKDNVTVTAYK